MGSFMSKKSSNSKRRTAMLGRQMPEVRSLNCYFNQDQQFSGPNGDVSVVLRNQTNPKSLGDHHSANNSLATFPTEQQRYGQSFNNINIPTSNHNNHLNHSLSISNNNNHPENHNPANQILTSNGISNINNHQQQLHYPRLSLNGLHPQQQQPQIAYRLYIALYDYEPRTPDDLKIQKGDQVEIIDVTNDDWWLAISKKTGERGYIPQNFVAPYNSIEAEPWYFGKMRRVDADKRLLLPENQHGAFIIRDSESKANDFSLSVRDGNIVKHYRIRQADSGGFFITKKTTFNTLQELVTHYSDSPDGLCVNLRLPCIRIDKPVTNDLSHKTKDEWEINRRTLTFLDKLGSGQFGQVYEGRWNNKIAVAIKTLKEGSMDKKDFLAEATIMKDLKHPKLIKLYAVCTQEEPILIVTELMRNGCLLDYLKTPAGEALDLRVLVNMAEQIANGMTYLEEKKYVHRDLAARNILVGEQNIVKIADFGLARFLIQEDLYEAKVGSRFPIKWTAPEAANFNKFSTKSDVWSFGILLTELVTYGRVPYPGMTNSDVLLQVEKGMRMTQESLGPNCTDQLYAIMLECWHKDPQKRLTFESLQWKLDELFDTDSSEYRDAGMMSHRN